MFKYELGQLVYYIENNKLHSASILSRIFVDNEKENGLEEFFQRFGEAKVMYATCHGEYDEDRLFSSKDDLAKSIIGQ